MSAVVVAVINRKGGVGKTTLVRDLGFALAERGSRVLQVGLDPQSSLEVLAGFGLETPPEQTVSRLLVPEAFGAIDLTESNAPTATPWGTWLVPASKALVAAERMLSEPTRAGAHQRLKRGLERVGATGRFDVVLVDCAPAMSVLAMNALVAADLVLVPTQLDLLSVAGLAVLTETIAEVREYDNPELGYLGIVGVQVDSRTRHAREIRSQLEVLFGVDAGGVLCQTTIRHSTRVRDAHAAGLAVGQLDADHPVSRDYRQLAAELALRAELSTTTEVQR